MDPEEYIQYHQDGSIMTKGQVIGDVPTGYRELFSEVGTIMHLGYSR